MKTTLLYLGVHRGAGFDQYLKKYSRGIGFEANPNLAQKLVRKYALNPNVEIVHAAAAQHNGKVQLNISSNEGASSSIGDFNDEWIDYQKGKITMIDSVEVPAVNVYDYLVSAKIDYIDCYVSDIQGVDCAVLKTLEPFILQKKIGSIICEVGRKERKQTYTSVPSNSVSDFEELLSENYKLVASGYGVLREGKFTEVPDEWWDMDCMWKPK